MRKPIIAGNWKMNKTPKETVALIDELKDMLAGAQAEVVVCPPAVCLHAAAKALQGSGIKLGAQNIHWADMGAYTGEISGDMLKEMGVQYVIVGHSERRQYFGETDETVNMRMMAAQRYGITPIICVGETLQEREAGMTTDVVTRQTKAALQGITSEEAVAMVIAYEPVWAIGTGRTATSKNANETCAIIRGVVRDMFGDAADALRIQYGGSMNGKNATELMAMPDIDGGLIGSAALTAADFAKVVLY